MKGLLVAMMLLAAAEIRAEADDPSGDAADSCANGGAGCGEPCDTACFTKACPGLPDWNNATAAPSPVLSPDQCKALEGAACKKAAMNYMVTADVEVSTSYYNVSRTGRAQDGQGAETGCPTSVYQHDCPLWDAMTKDKFKELQASGEPANKTACDQLETADCKSAAEAKVMTVDSCYTEYCRETVLGAMEVMTQYKQNKEICFEAAAPPSAETAAPVIVTHPPKPATTPAPTEAPKPKATEAPVVKASCDTEAIHCGSGKKKDKTKFCAGARCTGADDANCCIPGARCRDLGSLNSHEACAKEAKADESALKYFNEDAKTGYCDASVCKLHECCTDKAPPTPATKAPKGDLVVQKKTADKESTNAAPMLQSQFVPFVALVLASMALGM